MPKKKLLEDGRRKCFTCKLYFNEEDGAWDNGRYNNVGRWVTKQNFHCARCMQRNENIQTRHQAIIQDQQQQFLENQQQYQQQIQQPQVQLPQQEQQILDKDSITTGQELQYGLFSPDPKAQMISSTFQQQNVTNTSQTGSNVQVTGTGTVQEIHSNDLQIQRQNQSKQILKSYCPLHLQYQQRLLHLLQLEWSETQRQITSQLKQKIQVSQQQSMSSSNNSSIDRSFLERSGLLIENLIGRRARKLAGMSRVVFERGPSLDGNANSGTGSQSQYPQIKASKTIHPGCTVLGIGKFVSSSNNENDQQDKFNSTESNQEDDYDNNQGNQQQNLSNTQSQSNLHQVDPDLYNTIQSQLLDKSSDEKLIFQAEVIAMESKGSSDSSQSSGRIHVGLHTNFLDSKQISNFKVGQDMRYTLILIGSRVDYDRSVAAVSNSAQRQWEQYSQQQNRNGSQSKLIQSPTLDLVPCNSVIDVLVRGGQEEIPYLPGPPGMGEYQGHINNLNHHLNQNLSSLNQSQQLAIKTALESRFTLIQGPPGTGKTQVTCALVREIVKMSLLIRTNLTQNDSKRVKPILVTAESNAGLDQIVDRLADMNNPLNYVSESESGSVQGTLRPLRVLRLGLGAISKAAKQCSLHKWCQHHYDMQQRIDSTQAQIDEITEQQQDCKNQKSSCNNKSDLHDWNQLYLNLNRQKRDLLSQLQQLEYDIQDIIIKDNVDIVCSTLTGSGHDCLLPYRFQTVIVDEASQATEPRALISIKKALDRVILVGDHKQLPPFVLSEAAKSVNLGRNEQGLDVSLFERMIEVKGKLEAQEKILRGGSGLGLGNLGSSSQSVHSASQSQIQTHSLPGLAEIQQIQQPIQSCMLQIQYRMLPLIREWPSYQFYENKLEDGIIIKDDNAWSHCLFPDIHPVIFIDTNHLPDKPKPGCSGGPELTDWAPKGSKLDWWLRRLLKYKTSWSEQTKTLKNQQQDLNYRLSNLGYFTPEQKCVYEGSKSNQFEAHLIQRLVYVLSEEIEERNLTTSIGILTPYSAQVKLLKTLLSDQSSENSWEVINPIKQSQTYSQQSQTSSSESDSHVTVEIDTIDAFQGREKDIILFSCVRTERMGFLADPRRLNVALTRAKKQLIVVGDASVLCQDHNWGSWLAWVRKRGGWVGEGEE